MSTLPVVRVLLLVLDIDLTSKVELERLFRDMVARALDGERKLELMLNNSLKDRCSKEVDKRERPQHEQANGASISANSFGLPIALSANRSSQ